MAFIRILLYALLIYYVIKMIGRFFFPYVFRKSLEKFEEQYGNRQERQEEEKEGEISIEKKPDDTSGGKNQEGEYIEFEEVDN